jgi:hypothetical protein
MSQNPNLFLSVGKQVNDEYGHELGKIASFALTPSGKFDAVFIQQGDGKFSRHSVEHLKFDGVDVTLTSKVKSHADVLCDQIPLIWRKDQALKELSNKKKISKEVYEELHSSFDGVLNQLKSEAQGLTEEIDEEISGCSDEVRDLNYALVNLEIEHEIGKIDDQSYQTAFTMIQENLKRANTKKSDMELVRNKLSNITLGDVLKPSESVESKQGKVSEESSTSNVPELPEPPVVVYVKEIGRTGI